MAIKGLTPVQGIADAVLSTPDAVAPVLDQLVVDGLAATTAGAFRLTEHGTTRATALRDAERDAWGTDRAAAALDAFIALDHRVKDIVTAWQLRDATAQVINDHSDADYDRGVLDRLAAIHADAIAWLAPLEAGLPATRRLRRPAGPGARRGRRRRRPLRGITARRQLPRHLVRAPRGPDRPRRPEPGGRGGRRPRLVVVLRDVVDK